MQVTEILALFDREQRQDIEFPDMRKEVTGSVVRFVRDAPGMSFILYSDLDEATADRAVDEQVAYFSERQQPFEWKVFGHDRPRDLVHRLEARGFTLEDEDAVMVLDLSEAPDALLEPGTADVRRLTTPEQLGDVVAVLSSVWGGDFDWVYDRLGSHMALPGYLSVFVAYVENMPASAGWTYYYPGHFAGLWGGSTLETARGRGLYTALLSARVREARERGVAFLTIDAGPMSRPIVERYGFRLITTAIGCEWQPPAADVLHAG